jgi:hypothetical protein
MTGTVNISDSGPHAGEAELFFRLTAASHTGLTVDRPCPTCENDPTPRDRLKGGTCSGGPRHGQACDTEGSHDFFGTLSLDCPPPAGANVGNLRIVLEPYTTGTTTLTGGPSCSAFGFGDQQCPCETCASAGAEPCNTGLRPGRHRDRAERMLGRHLLGEPARRAERGVVRRRALG